MDILIVEFSGNPEMKVEEILKDQVTSSRTPSTPQNVDSAPGKRESDEDSNGEDDEFPELVL